MTGQVIAILLASDVTDIENTLVRRALADRGFEVFAACPTTQLATEDMPENFPAVGTVLIAFNALMSADGLRASAYFPQFETEKAAHLVSSVVFRASERIRITCDAAHANRVAESALGENAWAELNSMIVERQTQMATRLPVLRDLSRYQYRAKVELVDYNGRMVVKKTFRPTALDAMRRELAFHDAIEPQSQVPVRIIHRSNNAIFYEFVDDVFKSQRFLGSRLLTRLDLANTRTLADFVRLVLAAGWDPIDLTPAGNILIDRDTKCLRAIDFEFAHYSGGPMDPGEAAFLVGVPPGATFAHPLNNEAVNAPYNRQWRRFTALSLNSFLYDPAWLQRIKRTFIHPFWLVGYVVAETRRRARQRRQRNQSLRAIVWHPSA